MEEHFRVALTALADRISSVLQYQHPETLLSGEIALVRPAGESEDSCGLTEVTFSFSICTIIILPEVCKYSKFTELLFNVYDTVLYTYSYTFI
jgi:hypothetical protein